MSVGGARGGPSRRQGLGARFAESSDGHLPRSRSSLGLRGNGNDIEDGKKADGNEDVSPHAASHMRLSFGPHSVIRKEARAIGKTWPNARSLLAAPLAFAVKSLTAHDDFTPIRQLDGLGSAFGGPILARNASDGYGLPDIGGKVGSYSPAALHRDGGRALE